jgi:hypothetical protein
MNAVLALLLVLVGGGAFYLVARPRPRRQEPLDRDSQPLGAPPLRVGDDDAQDHDDDDDTHSAAVDFDDARTAANDFDAAADEAGDDDNAAFDPEMSALVRECVLPAPLLLDDPAADLTDDCVPGMRFAYVIPMGKRAPLLRRSGLQACGMTLDDVRRLALANAALVPDLALGPLSDQLPEVLTNHQGHPLAAGLLLDDGFWRARVRTHGIQLAAALSPSRVVFGVDSPRVREVLLGMLSHAPDIEDELCMRTLCQHDGVGWHAFVPDEALN